MMPGRFKKKGGFVVITLVIACAPIFAIDGTWQYLDTQSILTNAGIDDSRILSFSAGPKGELVGIIAPRYVTGPLRVAIWVQDHWEFEMSPIIFDKDSYGSHNINSEIDDLSQVHVAYKKEVANIKIYAVKNAGGWRTETIPQGFNSANNRFSVDSHGMAHFFGYTSDAGGWVNHYAKVGPEGWDMSGPDLGPLVGYALDDVQFGTDGSLFLGAKNNSVYKVFHSTGGPLTEHVSFNIPEFVQGTHLIVSDRVYFLSGSTLTEYPPLTSTEIPLDSDWVIGHGVVSRSNSVWMQDFPKDNINTPEHRKRYLYEKNSPDVSKEDLGIAVPSAINFIENIPFLLLPGMKDFPCLYGTIVNPLNPRTLSDVVMAKLPPPLEMGVSSFTATSISWSWPPPLPGVTGFRLRRSSDNGALSGFLPPSTTHWTMEGLPPNSSITAYLETIYPGFILPAQPMTGYTRPFPPESVRLARSDNGGLYAAWSANGNPAPTSYRLAFHAPNGTVLTATAGTPSYEYPLLSPLVPYGLGLATLGADGTELAMSSVTAVTTAPGQTRMVFDVGELTVETVLSPAEGFGNPVLAAGPASAFPANTTAGTAATGRGFQVEMDRALPRGQSAMVSVVYPAGWLDSAPGGPRVLARYDAARAEWVMFPTGQEGRRLTARADGFGTFQVMVRTETTYDTANVKAYPNPFQAGGEERLVVRDVPPGGRVRVMTLKGGLVRTLSGTETGFVEWDGCDEDGVVVKSGVYVLAVEGGGVSKKLKVIVEP